MAASAVVSSAAPVATPPAAGTIESYCFYWHQITAAPWGDWLSDPLKPGPGGSLPVITFGPAMSASISPNPAASDVKDAWNTVIYLGYQNQIDPSKPAVTPGPDFVAAVQKIEAFNAAKCP